MTNRKSRRSPESHLSEFIAHNTRLEHNYPAETFIQELHPPTLRNVTLMGIWGGFFDAAEKVRLDSDQCCPDVEDGGDMKLGLS